MYKILGDKIDRKVLNKNPYMKKNIQKKIKKKKNLIEPSINFDSLLFAGNDINMIKIIYPHPFFVKTFRLYPFRLSATLLNGIINIIYFFQSTNLQKMKKHLDCIELIWGYLKSKIDLFDFYLKLLDKMKNFYSFLEKQLNNKDKLISLDFLDEIYK